jgi:hypothetical protein
VLALDLGNRLEVAVEGGEHRRTLLLLQGADARRHREAPIPRIDGRQAVEQLDPRLEPRDLEHVAQRAVGVLQRQSELAVAGRGRERAHHLGVGGRVGLDQPPDRLVGERLAEAEQRERPGHALEVPGVVPEVGLVEVVDVEDEHALGVHVGAVVLGVQVALDPHTGRVVVHPGVLEALDVGVEQRSAAAIEGERVGGHLAELLAEGDRIGLDQVGEGVDEDRDDVLLALVVGRVEGGEVGHGPGNPPIRSTPASAIPDLVV